VLRILVLDAQKDFGVLIAEILDIGEHVEARHATFPFDVNELATWRPDAVLVTTELLTSTASVNSLRSALPSLRYIVGMADERFPPANTFGCDRLVVRPFPVEALLRELRELLPVA
jgi:hypothetical protein